MHLTRLPAVDEVDMGPRDPILSTFLEAQLERMVSKRFKKTIVELTCEDPEQLVLELLKNTFLDKNKGIKWIN